MASSGAPFYNKKERRRDGGGKKKYKGNPNSRRGHRGESRGKFARVTENIIPENGRREDDRRWNPRDAQDPLNYLHNDYPEDRMKGPVTAYRMQREMNADERMGRELEGMAPSTFPVDRGPPSHYGGDVHREYNARKVVQENNGEGVVVQVRVPNVHGSTRIQNVRGGGSGSMHMKEESVEGDGYACVIPTNLLQAIFGGGGSGNVSEGTALDMLKGCRKYLTKDSHFTSMVKNGATEVMKDRRFSKSAVTGGIKMLQEGELGDMKDNIYFLPQGSEQIARMYAMQGGGLIYGMSVAGTRLDRDGGSLPENERFTHLPVSDQCLEVLKTNYSSLFLKKIYFDPPPSQWESETDLYAFIDDMAATIIKKIDGIWDASTTDDISALITECGARQLTSYVGLAISMKEPMKELRKPEVYSPHLPITIPVHDKSGRFVCSMIPFIRLKMGRAVPFFRPYNNVINKVTFGRCTPRGVGSYHIFHEAIPMEDHTGSFWYMTMELSHQKRCLAMALAFASVQTLPDDPYSWICMTRGEVLGDMMGRKRKKIKGKNFFLPSCQTMAKAFWQWTDPENNMLSTSKDPSFSEIITSIYPFLTHEKLSLIVPPDVREPKKTEEAPGMVKFGQVERRETFRTHSPSPIPSTCSPVIPSIMECEGEETRTTPERDVNWKRIPNERNGGYEDYDDDLNGLEERRSDDDEHEDNYDMVDFPTPISISEPTPEEVCIFMFYTMPNMMHAFLGKKDYILTR